ncbi:DUF4007 family protein [Dorea longicatena]|uniref:DUF4007 family protein n=1 Tax=Dorea longicatena TaxID=88431 RepID=UPI0034A44A44
MATEKIKIKLQGHEKFALREGWINKALQILPENPDAFTRRDATDLFGIGSNMVKSLRYWMRAFGLTNNAGTELSETGRLIAQYDPCIICFVVVPNSHFINKDIWQFAERYFFILTTV